MTHITLGCGGHRLSDVGHEQPAWLAATAAKFGYGRVTVDDGYSLTFEFVRTDVSAFQGFCVHAAALCCCVLDDLLQLRLLLRLLLLRMGSAQLEALQSAAEGPGLIPTAACQGADAQGFGPGFAGWPGA